MYLENFSLHQYLEYMRKRINDNYTYRTDIHIISFEEWLRLQPKPAYPKEFYEANQIQTTISNEDKKSLDAILEEANREYLEERIENV